MWKQHVFIGRNKSVNVSLSSDIRHLNYESHDILSLYIISYDYNGTKSGKFVL